MYSGPEKSLSEIKNYLQTFGGGQIDLKLNSENGIATLCLNNAAKRNAISGKMMIELAAKITELENWSSGKGVLLFGAGGTFCSGGDLTLAQGSGTPEHGYSMAVFMQDTLSRLQQLPMLSVALIDGSGALGGGAELAVSCDFRLATDTAAGIGFVHASMGIIPAWGGVTSLVNLVGYTKALDMMATADVHPPERCRHDGLVDEIIPTTDALRVATEWLSRRARHHVTVTRALKLSAACARRCQPPDALALEKRLFAPLWGAPPNREALAKNIKHVKRLVK